MIWVVDVDKSWAGSGKEEKSKERSEASTTRLLREVVDIDRVGLKCVGLDAVKEEKSKARVKGKYYWDVERSCRYR